MKNTHQNTILITGGGSGIGLETAKVFAEKGNTVIITGRNAKKLENAAKQSPNIHFIPCDITNDEQVRHLVTKIHTEYGSLNVLINNAAEVHVYRLGESTKSYEMAHSEIQTNYLSIVNLTEKLLPLLKKQPESAIINISSIVAFAPSINLPTYSAGKAALHSYTQSLRLTLAQNTSVKVFEVMPPLVDTEFAKDINAEKIPPSVVADAIMDGFQNDNFEIRIGFTETFYSMYLQSPENALHAMNGIKAK